MKTLTISLVAALAFTACSDAPNAVAPEPESDPTREELTLYLSRWDVPDVAAATERAVRGLQRLAAARAPIIKLSGSDTPCMGVLVGTFDNVVVPPGGFCLIVNSIVLGNVKGLENSVFTVDNTEVRGSVQGDKADVVQVRFGSEIFGNLEIFESGHPFFIEAFLFVSTVHGNTDMKKAAGTGGVIVDRSTVDQNLNIEENRDDGAGVRLLNTTVGQNANFLKNTGTGLKQVQGNTVAQTLKCTENTPPFIGGPNVAGKTEGQCF
jgi:hypothetical protein